MSARRFALLLLLLGGGACQSAGVELGGLAATAPLDYAVLLTGGAFLAPAAEPQGTFSGHTSGEPIGIGEVAGVLAQGNVFRRAAIDDDPAHRRAIGRQFTGTADRAAMLAFLRDARDRGFDLLLVVEELRDGPIDSQGINARWPVTFATWILLGVGALIPDHTFESRATLRVTLRDLDAGRILNESLLVGGPVELALTERTDWLGLLSSILVPPFWVGDDATAVRDSVEAVTRRRMLVSLAHDLKSETLRQRLLRSGAATLQLQADGQGQVLVVDAAQSLSTVLLRTEPPLPPEVEREFGARFLASLTPQGEGFRYRAALPPALHGHRVQVLVATIQGGVASATFVPGGEQ